MQWDMLLEHHICKGHIFPPLIRYVPNFQSPVGLVGKYGFYHEVGIIAFPRRDTNVLKSSAETHIFARKYGENRIYVFFLKKAA